MTLANATGLPRHGSGTTSNVCSSRTIPSSDGRPTIMVIGDSISIGWYTALENENALKGYQIVHNPCNGEYSGYTLFFLDEWLSSRPEFYAIIWNNGLWDIASWIDTSLGDYVANEEEIAIKIKSKTARPLFLNTTGILTGAPGRTDLAVQEYNEPMAALMKYMRIPLLDMYGYSHTEPLDEQQLPGDVHFTTKGYEEISRIVLRELRRIYGIK
jgi:hypothetical protein